MKYNQRGEGIIEFLIVIAIISILSSIVIRAVNDDNTASAKQVNESKVASEVQKDLALAVPIPQLTNSLERENVAKRAEIFNTPDKMSYIYLLSHGKVMAFFTVKGKVSSLQSYMVPTEKLIKGNGEPCTWSSEGCHVVQAPDIDGTYGENVEGIFFFTTEGAYVEWKGEYMMSDQPLRLSTQPELIRQIN